MARTPSTSSAPSSDSSWELVRDASEESATNLRAMGLTPETLRIFEDNSYTQWTSRDGGGIAETTEVQWNALGIGLGDQERLRIGLERYRAGTLSPHYFLPRGDLRFMGTADPIQGAWQERGRTIDDLVSWFFSLGWPYLLCIALAVHSFPTIIALGVHSFLGGCGDCLDGDTKITSADRRQIPIRKLQAGDALLSYFNNKFFVVRVLKVTRTIVPACQLCRIDVQGHESIIATRNHLFFCNIKKWCAVTPHSSHVKALAVWHRVVRVDGGTAPVLAITDTEEGKPREVFNLLVEGHGAFFANGLLTHNGIPVSRTEETATMPQAGTP